MTFAPQQRIGPFRALRVIRMGQICQIVECLRDATGERVALKVLAGKYVHDRTQMALMKHEYAVGRTLHHPTVIKIMGFEQLPEYAYLVMEYFPAPNMKQWVQGGIERLFPHAAKIIERTAEGLAHMHEKGWIHRDIKADNFLINESGDVRLIDFAISQKKKSFFGRLLGGGAAIQGTRSYISPEQIRNESLDERADIYSYGCVLFELLAGRPPFSGSSTTELLNKHLKSSPPSLEASNRHVSIEFARLVRKMLAKEPKERPGSVAEFLKAFREMKLWETTPPAPRPQSETL